MKNDFQQVVTQYAASLYRLAYSYCGNHPDTEDVLQEVYLKYLRCEIDFPAEAQRRSWLMTVTANECRDLLRSAWHRKRRFIEELPETAAPEADDQTQIHDAIASLPVAYRGVVYLYYFEDYDSAEIAQALGISASAVRSRLERARKQLKDLLGGS